MPFPVCRVGDIGTGFCLCHGRQITVTIILGSPTVLAGGLPTARLGDIVISDCGHLATIITGNPLVLAFGTPKARVSDLFLGNDPVCVGPIGVLNVGLPTVLA